MLKELLELRFELGVWNDLVIAIFVVAVMMVAVVEYFGRVLANRGLAFVILASVA